MILRNAFLIVTFLAQGIPAPGIAQSPSQTGVSAETDAPSLLSAFISYTDLRIRSVERSLEILASTSEAGSGEWQNMKDFLSGYQRSDEGLIVWYARPDGTYFTVDQGLVSETLSDRSYFPDLMAGKKITGALVVSKSTGRRSAVIAVPVVKAGKVTGAVGASLFLDKLADQIAAALALRPDVTFFSLAPNGLTTLHRRTERHFLDPRELGSETLKRATDEMLSATSGKTTYEYDNATKTAVYGTSALTHWKFAIAFGAAPQR